MNSIFSFQRKSKMLELFTNYKFKKYYFNKENSKTLLFNKYYI
jgi:hypothetical protein